MFIAYPDEIRTLLRTFNSAEFLSWGNTPTTYEQVEEPYGTVLSRLKRGVEKLKKDIGNTTGNNLAGGA